MLVHVGPTLIQQRVYVSCLPGTCLLHVLPPRCGFCGTHNITSVELEVILVLIHRATRTSTMSCPGANKLNRTTCDPDTCHICINEFCNFAVAARNPKTRTQVISSGRLYSPDLVAHHYSAWILGRCPRSHQTSDPWLSQPDDQLPFCGRKKLACLPSDNRLNGEEAIRRPRVGAGTEGRRLR